MAFLDEALTDRITDEARRVDFGKALLGFIAAALVFLGRALGVTVMAVAWCFVAFRTGYRDVRPSRSQQPARR